MKKTLVVVFLVLMFAWLPVLADVPQRQTGTDESASGDQVTKTYTLRYVSPEFVKNALRIYLRNWSYGDGSNLFSAVLEKKNVAAFEEQLRKLDVEKKIIQLRIFTVIAGKTGTGSPIENKDLKQVLTEVSKLLNFKSYELDGASTFTVKDGFSGFGKLALSSAMNENLLFSYRGISIYTGNNGKRAVKLEFWLTQGNSKQELLSSQTEIAENGYLVAGVSRIGRDGKSLVLVINAEIK